ncbi:MAG: TonB-dependent receptor [Bacteroidetes bacterium]|nr:TonB-dependent receptor [Bacteroidota bacterium]
MYRFIIVFVACHFLVPLSHAQENGSITGRVYDAVTKEPLIGANVFVRETSFGAATDLNGRFTIRAVPAGTYRVQASVIGYKAIIASDVVAAPGRETQLDFALQPTAIDLDEVVVEADYFRELADAPVSAQTLSYEEIRRSPGGQEDVIRAISVLPGVVQVSAGRNDLIVRGGAPSENLYVVDNLEIPNINHFGTQGATGGPLSFINLDFVRDVTFTTGGFGARYGDKLSSVMNIQLKEGRRDRLGGKLNISATQFGANGEGPLGENGSFLFSARRSYLDLIFKAAGFGFVPEYWDFIGKANYSLDRTNEISFLAIGALDKVRFFNDDEDQRFSNSRILGNSQDQYFSSIAWKHLMTNGFLTVALGRTFTTYDFLQTDSLLAPVFVSNSREGESSLRADGVFLFDRSLELSFGAQGKLGRVEGDFAWTPTSNSFLQGPDIQNLENAWDTTALKANAYVQLARTFFSNLRVTVGGRLDYFNLIDEPVAVGPRASLRYAVTDLTTLSLSGGTYYQSPSYIWLLSNPANTRLRHVRVDQAVLGVEHLLQSDLRVRVEGYVKNYSDYPASTERPYLVLANTGAGFGGAEEGFSSFGFDNLISGGEGQSRGVELLVQKRLSDIPLYGIFSLSYNNTEYTALDGVSRPGSFDQRIIMNLSGGWKIDENWEVSAKFRYGTGTPYTPYLADGRSDFAAFNGERLPDFHTLDLRVDRRWNFNAWNLVTYVDVQNVYNRKNVQQYRWDPRNARVETAGGAIGILPSIGISAEF